MRSKKDNKMAPYVNIDSLIANGDQCKFPKASFIKEKPS